MGGAGISQTIGRGVAELYNVTRLVRNVGMWERRNIGYTNILIY